MNLYPLLFTCGMVTKEYGCVQEALSTKQSRTPSATGRLRTCGSHTFASPLISPAPACAFTPQVDNNLVIHECSRDSFCMYHPGGVCALCVCVCMCMCVCVCVCVCICLSVIISVYGWVIFVSVDTVHRFYGYCFLCLVGCFSMIIWAPTVLSVLYACVLYFCIWTCSAQLSMFHIERCSRNTLIIIIITVEF